MSYDKEYQTYRIGLMKDQLTEIIPCVYDTISLDEEGRYVAKLPDKIHYFNADQILLDFKQGDERKANRDIINKAYHDLINSEKWDMVDKPDRNGFCRVMKIDTEEGKILFGVMRDPETEELPVIYDLIEMNENGSYTVKKDGETDILDCKNGKYKIH
ncbi:MAG: hypothetical protein LBO09_02740 [Candidatus Peribacteria bacterium]|jgi:hypothetical protein|nr:hypothetical protein [Candidatus Peribacteria bacterium]